MTTIINNLKFQYRDEELYKEFREIYHIVHGTVVERLFGKENYKKLKGEKYLKSPDIGDKIRS